MIDASVLTQRASQRISGIGATNNPFGRVLELGATDRRWALSLALALALLVHVGMAGAIHLRGERLAADDASPVADQELAIEREVLPPLPPPAPEPPPPPPDPPKIAWNVTAAAPPDPGEHPEEEPASAPAQAGEVLVQDSDEEEDEDADDPDEVTFVTGHGDGYAGAMTVATGTSALAVRGSIVETGGVSGGLGMPAPAPKPAVRDLSRGAWLEGSTSWDCDFPGEADRDHINNAAVEMAVTVRPNGTAQSVTIVEDPGHGFARTASACALKHKFLPALDPQGHTIWGTTRAFHVGFHR